MTSSRGFNASIFGGYPNQTECSTNTFVDSFWLSPEISYYATTGPLDNPAMEDCCESNPVNLINRCYVWCEIPDSYLERAENPVPRPGNRSVEFRNKVLSLFGDCMSSREEWRNLSGPATVRVANTTIGGGGDGNGAAAVVGVVGIGRLMLFWGLLSLMFSL